MSRTMRHLEVAQIACNLVLGCFSICGIKKLDPFFKILFAMGAHRIRSGCVPGYRWAVRLVAGVYMVNHGCVFG